MKEKTIRRIGEAAVAAVMVRAGKIDSGVCHSLRLENVRRRCRFSELATRRASTRPVTSPPLRCALSPGKAAQAGSFRYVRGCVKPSHVANVCYS